MSGRSDRRPVNHVLQLWNRRAVNLDVGHSGNASNVEREGVGVHQPRAAFGDSVRRDVGIGVHARLYVEDMVVLGLRYVGELVEEVVEGVHCDGEGGFRVRAEVDVEAEDPEVDVDVSVCGWSCLPISVRSITGGNVSDLFIPSMCSMALISTDM